MSNPLDALAHPARITLYTDPDGRPAVVWVNGAGFAAINNDSGRAAVAFIHLATSPSTQRTTP